MITFYELLFEVLHKVFLFLMCENRSELAQRMLQLFWFVKERDWTMIRRVTNKIYTVLGFVISVNLYFSPKYLASALSSSLDTLKVEQTRVTVSSLKVPFMISLAIIFRTNFFFSLGILLYHLGEMKDKLLFFELEKDPRKMLKRCSPFEFFSFSKAATLYWSTRISTRIALSSSYCVIRR